MDLLTFDDVADLINRIGNTSISRKPVKERPREWALFEGSADSGGMKFNFMILYLFADATLNSFQTAIAAIQQSGGAQSVQVVFAPSLAEKYPQQIARLRAAQPTAVPLTDYFASFIRQQVDNYITKVRALPHRHYIDPQIRVPSGSIRKVPNPVLSLLTERESLAGGKEGAVGILLAEPGQGKTFMSRY